MISPANQFLHHFAEQLLSQSDFICWPPFGYGNSLRRIFAAHSDYLYNCQWNDWGTDLPSPLTPPRVLRACSNPNFPEFYGAAHYASILSPTHDWIAQNQSLYEATVQRLEQGLKETQNKQWAVQWLKQSPNIRFDYPIEPHYPASKLIAYTDRPIIQLYCKSSNTILQRSNHAAAKNILGHLEQDIVEHPQILNCAIEDLFFSNFETFAHEYERIRAHFSIKENLIEQVWGFILYQRDRNERQK